MAERHAELAEGEQELAADPEFAERFAEFDQIDLGEPTEDEDSDALDGDEAPDAEESADPAKAPEQKPQQTPDTQPAPTPDQGTQPEQQVEPEAGALRWRADHKDFHIPGSKIEGEFILIPKEHEPHIRSLLSEGVSARGSVRTTISSLQSELEAARFDAQHSTDVLTARALLEAVEQVIDADDGDAFLAMFSKDTWPATKKRLREQAELQQLRARQTAGTPQRGAQEPRGDTNAPPAVPAQQGGSSIHPDVTPFSAVVTDEAALMGDLRPVLRDQLTELRDATPALKALTNDDLDDLAGDPRHRGALVQHAGRGDRAGHRGGEHRLPGAHRPVVRDAAGGGQAAGDADAAGGRGGTPEEHRCGSGGTAREGAACGGCSGSGRVRGREREHDPAAAQDAGAVRSVGPASVQREAGEHRAGEASDLIRGRRSPCTTHPGLG
jgi:hypothetical protein